jgi:hypothetical protein
MFWAVIYTAGVHPDAGVVPHRAAVASAGPVLVAGVVPHRARVASAGLDPVAGVVPDVALETLRMRIAPVYSRFLGYDTLVCLSLQCSFHLSTVPILAV